MNTCIYIRSRIIFKDRSKIVFRLILKKKDKSEETMVFGNRETGRRHVQPTVTKGEKPAGYWVSVNNDICIVAFDETIKNEIRFTFF